MILSHEHKFIFIHIGKTAGSAIERTLCELMNIKKDETRYNEEVIKNIDKIGFTPSWAVQKDHNGKINCKHIAAKELKQIVGDKIWNQYFTFSFVRNPYNRLLSEFSMFTQHEEFKSHRWNRHATFEDFLDAVLAGKEHIIGNPFSQYLTDSNGNLLIKFIGKFETLQADFDTICDNIGLPKKELLKPRKPTDHRSYDDYYNKETQEIIYKIYEHDFHLTGYAKYINGIKPASFAQRNYISLKYFMRHFPGRLKNKIK